MDEHRSSNGHHPPPESNLINPYLDAVTGARPPEIVEFERNTAPYSQMPPNNSQAIAPLGLTPSRNNWREHPILTAVSLLMLLLLLAPVILTVFDHFLR